MTPSLNSEQPININDLDAMLGPRPTLPSEDHKAYDQLTYKFREAIAPQDIIEEILIRDAIDITWEIQRLKDFKKQLLHMQRDESLKKILESLFGYNGYDTPLYEKWRNNDPTAVKAINDLLAKKGLNPSVIDSFGFRSQLDNIERFDRLIMQAEVRRSAHLREVDRHRSSLAELMRNTIARIEKERVIDHDPNTKAD
jgi:hypothetical protein